MRAQVNSPVCRLQFLMRSSLIKASLTIFPSMTECGGFALDVHELNMNGD